MDWRRLLALAILLAALPAAALTPPAVRAAEVEGCFPETGACVREPFLAYWQANGGVPIYGLPLADAGLEVLEDGQLHLVQYFERARLELHWRNPQEGPTEPIILLGQFGRLLHPAEPAVPARAGASYFPETGHNVAPDFVAFWEANGGLPRFGYPLSEEFAERLEDGNTYTVQYFERARFERHPRNAAPHAIQLGQFGRVFYRRSLLSPRDMVRMCGPEDLLVTAGSGAAAGSTYVTVTLQHQGGAPCRLLGFLQPSLFAADGAELPVITRYSPAFNAPRAQSPFTLLPGQTAEGVLQWANNCQTGSPIDPAPATWLGIALPSGTGEWRFPIGGPRCGGTGDPKAISSHALALDLGGAAHTGYLVLDWYFADISNGRYQHAFSLFSPEMQAQIGPYERFADGFAGTRFVTFAITGWRLLDSQTTRLSVRLVARQTDGTARYYLGSYDVRRLPEPVTTYPDGRIVAADVVEEFP